MFKINKFLAAAALVVSVAGFSSSAYASLNDGRTKRYKTAAEIVALTAVPPGVTAAYAVDTGATYLWNGSAFIAVVPPAMYQVRFCGNGSATGVADYMGPVREHIADNMTIYAFSGSGCDALNSATEATADEAVHAAWALQAVAMSCVGLCTGATAANDAITYQLRTAGTTDVTGMTCTAAAWTGDATPSQCSVYDPTPTTAIAAGATVAVKTIGTNDACEAAGDDFECVVWFRIVSTP